MGIVIDEEFKKLIPPLTDEEFAQLEANVIADGCRDPLVLWGEIIIDGHNRHDICTRHGIEFKTVQMEFESRAHVRVWMRSNQRGRRNLTTAWLIELALGDKEDLLEIGRAKMSEGGGDKKSEQAKSGLSLGDKPDPQPPAPKVNTQKEIAKTAGVSTGQVGMAEQVIKKAPELWEKAKRGEMSVKAAYNTVKKEENREEIKAANAAQVRQSETAPMVQCGDSLDWMQTLDMQDLLLTDPPYSTDVEDIDSFVEWLPKAWAKVKPTGRAYVFIGAYPHEIRAYLNVCERHNINVEQILTWSYKNTMGPKPKRKYFLNYQSVLYIVGEEAPDLDCDMLVELCAAQEANHPARSVEREYMWQKPDSLVEQYIRHSTRHGDKVFDPFCGSGTTMIAAAKLGRIGKGCEIQRTVADIAVKRGCVEA